MTAMAEAIIVVGPVLWKCVNCDLLFSRHHSTDDHIRSYHNPPASELLNHTDPWSKKCDISRCCCRSLRKGVSNRLIKQYRSSVEKESEDPMFVNNGNVKITIGFSEEDTAEEKKDELDETCDEEDIPQTLRDLVERASRQRQMEAKILPGGCDDSVISKTTVLHNMTDTDCVDSVSSVDNDPLHSFNADCFLMSNDSASHEGVHQDSDDVECDQPQTSSITNLGHKQTDSLSQKRRGSTDKSIGEGPTAKRAKTLKATEEKSSVVVQESSTQSKGRRTSGRANKGKNSMYSEYKVEIV